MPTTVFPITDPAVVPAGSHSDGWVSYPAVTLARTFQGDYSGFDVVATGTDLTLRCLGQTYNAGTVIVDGGSPVALSGFPAAGSWGDVTLFSGLSATAHSVRLRCTNLPVYFPFDLDNALSLTGSAPALSLPSWGGPVYPIVPEVVRGSVALAGGWDRAQTAGYTDPRPLTTIRRAALIRFRATTTTINLWCRLSGQQYQLLVDGTPTGGITTAANDGTWEWLTLGTGLDGSNGHEYAVLVNSGSSPNYALCLAGTGIDASPTGLYPARDVLFALGDSITEGGALSDITTNWPWLAAAPKGYDIANWAAGGTAETPIVWASLYPAGPSRVDSYGNLMARPPAVVVYAYGHNDAAYGTGAPLFGYSAGKTLARMTELWPDATVLVLGILPTTAFSDPTRANYNAALTAAVTAASNPNMTYLNTDSWIVPVTDTGDGIHPNAAGCVKIAAEMAPYIPVAANGVVGGGGGFRRVAMDGGF